MTQPFTFETLATDGNARAGVLHTPHGPVLTPTFMPVGTTGAVKTMLPEEVRSTGAQIVLGNTYHLWLRPGAEVVAAHGGLHGFSHWKGAMLTDSGGFQAFSLDDKCKRTEDGYIFRSHLDGTKHHLSPEEAMRVQRLLGADIAMQLDVCPPGGSPAKDVEEAVAMTTRWGRRCLEAKRQADDADGPDDQGIFGIIQGGTDRALRRAHADELAGLEVGGMRFAGLALGGFSVGEPIETMYEVLADVAPAVDPSRARYLMGVGKPADLVVGIASGIDMFDCVLPTRNGRNGHVLTRTGRVIIRHARYKNDHEVLEPGCACPACAGGYTRAYLRHLFMSNEMLSMRLFTHHNLHLYGTLVAEARQAILDGRFEAFRNETLARLSTPQT